MYRAASAQITSSGAYGDCSDLLIYQGNDFAASDKRRLIACAYEWAFAITKVVVVDLILLFSDQTSEKSIPAINSFFT